MRCSYAATLNCDGNCGVCPRQTLLPVREPGQGPHQAEPARRDGRAPDGGGRWTQLGTRPGAWPASCATPRCAFDLARDEAELAELTERSGRSRPLGRPDRGAGASCAAPRSCARGSAAGASSSSAPTPWPRWREMAAAEPEGARVHRCPTSSATSPPSRPTGHGWSSTCCCPSRSTSAAAIVSVYAGAGGTESQDWAEMLLRMYLRWAERSRFKTEILEADRGRGRGPQERELRIDGRWAYGRLRSERGVHRLVRISPFDSQKRRHTSFALVEVMPEVPEDASLEIDEKELRVDTYRASRRRRPAREQDRQRGAHHAPADRDRGGGARASAASTRTATARWPSCGPS